MDFAASEVTVTEERAKHVDFTTSFWGEDITFMVKVSNENKLFIYSRLFDVSSRKADEEETTVYLLVLLQMKRTTPFVGKHVDLVALLDCCVLRISGVR